MAMSDIPLDYNARRDAENEAAKEEFAKRRANIFAKSFLGVAVISLGFCAYLAKENIFMQTNMRNLEQAPVVKRYVGLKSEARGLDYLTASLDGFEGFYKTNDFFSGIEGNFNSLAHAVSNEQRSISNKINELQRDEKNANTIKDYNTLFVDFKRNNLIAFGVYSAFIVPGFLYMTNSLKNAKKKRDGILYPSSKQT